jgi:septal ring factor EnvC (AmiA/AmiB activator)
MATVAPTPWQPIGEIVAEFRNECSDFDHLVQSLFDQLDQLRAELDRKMRELERERQRVQERERQLAEQRKETSRIAHQFEHQEAKLSETLTELEELKGLVKSVNSPNLSTEAALAKELAQARQELAELRAARQTGEDDSERAALEAELEMVRSRAAELHETLAQERRALAEQRNEAANELKQLRRIVEKQAELLGERPAGGHPTVARETVRREGDGNDQADPVINSVMQQFAKLQKEVAERRKHRKP